MKAHIQLTTDDGKQYSAVVELRLDLAKAASPKASQPTQSGGHKCPDVIEKLWKKGEFKQGLDFARVKAAVEALGYSFKDNNIHVAMTRAKFLTRHGSKGASTWKQKFPAS